MVETSPHVGVIMGSKSDLPQMIDACRVLDELSIPNQARIISAHRTPDRMFEYAKTARERGIRVIIAGAGGAAHLPGMTGSETQVPVIAVPIVGSKWGGVDSLLSELRMPNGVPVAVVDNSRNAGLYAAQILAVSNDELFTRLTTLKQKLQQASENDDLELQSMDPEKYLKMLQDH